MRRYDDLFNNLGLLSQRPFYLVCIIAMRGYDFREGHWHASRSFRIAGRSLGPAGIARAVEHLIELGFKHGLQEFVGSIPKTSFNRIEPVVEKVHR